MVWRRSLDEADQLKNNRALDKSYKRGKDAKTGDHKAFQNRVNKFRVSNGMEPMEVKR